MLAQRVIYVDAQDNSNNHSHTANNTITNNHNNSHNHDRGFRPPAP